VIEKVVYDVDVIIDVLNSEELNVSQIEKLLRFYSIHILGYYAHKLRLKIFDKLASFISNMILNYTNVCIVACKFCAFYRRLNSSDAYFLSINDAIKLVEKVDNQYGIRQVLIQGGLHPEISIEYFEELFRKLKAKLPHIAIHALSPIEIHYLSIKERMSYREVLERLKIAGMDSMPGGGGEILVDSIRQKISPKKISTDTWIKIMEISHKLGIPGSATMMYGHVESITDRAEHLKKILDLQFRTRGFNAFIAWNFEPGNTELQKEGIVKYSSGGSTLLKIIATARLVFKHYIPNIQSSWLTNGIELAQLSLLHGANDFGGTLYEERVIPATGLKVKFLTRDQIVNLIRRVNLKPVERDNYYNVIRYY